MAKTTPQDPQTQPEGPKPIGRAVAEPARPPRRLRLGVRVGAMGDDPHGAFNGGVGNRDVDTVPAQ